MAQPVSKLVSPRIQAALYYARKRLRNRRKSARADPELTDPPAVSGTPQVGEELTADPGVWEDDPTFSYQWLRNSEPIVGAKALTYTLTEADEGTEISVSVTARSATGFGSATSEAVGPIEGAA